MLPGLVAYLITFASIAGYWTIHHSTFRHVRQSDGRFVVLSLVNLLFITLFPATASIVGGHPLDPLATACLSTNSLLYCLSSWALWSHTAAKRQLLVEEDAHCIVRRVARIMGLIGVGLALAIPLAFVSSYLAYAIWTAWPPASAISVHRASRASS
jgi:uncharacterized membrane protein